MVGGRAHPSVGFGALGGAVCTAMELLRAELHRYSLASQAQRDASLKRWARLGRVIPLVIAVSYSVMIGILFPYVEQESQVAWALYGGALAVGAIDLFPAASLMPLLVCFVCQALGWYGWGADLAWPGVVVSLALLAFLLYMGRQQALLALDHVMLDARVRQLNAELNRRNSDLQQRGQQRGHLLASVGHDLLQPVHAMEMLLGLADAPGAGKQGQSIAGVLRSQSDMLADMINGLLDYSQIAVGRYALHRTPFEFNTLVEEVSLAHQALARHKCLRFDLNLRSTAGCWVHSDRALLGRMVSNVISNAVKYTPAGSVVLTSQCVEGQQIRLQVADTGLGIAVEKQATVFAPFVRAVSEEERRDLPGMGIGLSIVERGAALLGVSVHLESHPRVGTRFSFLMERADPPPQPQRSCPENCLPLGRATRILLVDGDDVTRQTSRDVLCHWGFDVEAAAGYAQALALIKDGPESGFVPDVLLTEFHLDNGYTGPALQAELVRRGFRDIKGVLLTSVVQSPADEQALTPGFTLLYKPLPARALNTKLRASVCAGAV